MLFGCFAYSQLKRIKHEVMCFFERMGLPSFCMFFARLELSVHRAFDPVVKPGRRFKVFSKRPKEMPKHSCSFKTPETPENHGCTLENRCFFLNFCSWRCFFP